MVLKPLVNSGINYQPSPGVLNFQLLLRQPPCRPDFHQCHHLQRQVFSMVRFRSEDKVIRLFVLKGYEHLESRNLLGKDGCPTPEKNTHDFQHLLRFQHLETRKLHHTSVWIQPLICFPPGPGDHPGRQRERGSESGDGKSAA